MSTPETPEYETLIEQYLATVEGEDPEIVAALTLAADVRTLNEWVSAQPKRTPRAALRSWQVTPLGCYLETLDARPLFASPTPEAAIHAAAEAVRKGSV